MSQPRKIDIAIIGAQKAGTTSLKSYLGEHPQVVTHPHIEFSFFADNDQFELGYEKIFKKDFGSKHIEITHKVLAKNVTLSFREFALERLRLHNPDCKICLLYTSDAADE